MIAHLTAWKGHALFLEIARRIADRVPTSRFIIAGGEIYETDGHLGLRESLIAQCAAFGLANRVTFLGARDDIPEILAALDVLVHCPQSPEPFGRNIAEAMAIGRPVVAARSGGVQEIVDDGVTGLLVAPGDVDSFTTAVVRLLSDSPLRKAYGAAARQRAEAMFGADRHAAAIIDAYATLLPTLAVTA
jgi:glycosyltransferase involved in cell wall biosynthesis